MTQSTNTVGHRPVVVPEAKKINKDADVAINGTVGTSPSWRQATLSLWTNHHKTSSPWLLLPATFEIVPSWAQNPACLDQSKGCSVSGAIGCDTQRIGEVWNPRLPHRLHFLQTVLRGDEVGSNHKVFEESFLCVCQPRIAKQSLCCCTNWKWSVEPNVEFFQCRPGSNDHRLSILRQCGNISTSYCLPTWQSTFYL